MPQPSCLRFRWALAVVLPRRALRMNQNLDRKILGRKIGTTIFLSIIFLPSSFGSWSVSRSGWNRKLTMPHPKRADPKIRERQRCEALNLCLSQIFGFSLWEIHGCCRQLIQTPSLQDLNLPTFTWLTP